jgi:hypothetical protein
MLIKIIDYMIAEFFKSWKLKFFAKKVVSLECLVFFTLFFAFITPTLARLVSVETFQFGDARIMNRYGALSTRYATDKYEVPVAQYTSFLNAVAKTDPIGPGDASISTRFTIGGIARSGTVGIVNCTHSHFNAVDSSNKISCEMIAKVDFDVASPNVPVTADVSTNDPTPNDTRYRTLIEGEENAQVRTLTMTHAGTYEFKATEILVYSRQVLVHALTHSRVCPLRPLQIRALDPLAYEYASLVKPNIAIANEDSPITIDILSNDQSGNAGKTFDSDGWSIIRNLERNKNIKNHFN